MADMMVAAQELEGRTLKSGWLVNKRITRRKTDTGGNFSVCYEVEKDGKKCFLKAIDFSKYLAIKSDGVSVIDLLSKMTSDFKYERDLSNFCQARRVTKVAFVIESGEENLDGYTYGVVPYLIFEMADGDVRSMLAYSEKLDFAWKMKSLHDVSIGLNQLHKIGVSHQDLKPSNILLFNSDSKIGDLGRSLCPTLNKEMLNVKFHGDYNYAPPEIMYNYVLPDWNKRTFLADCYMLGSMVVFYLTGVSMNSILISQLPKDLHPFATTASFIAVKDYLTNAFEASLKKISQSIPYDIVRERLINVIKYLCCPDPERRGHPKTIASRDSNYNLERFVSEFNYLHRIAELELYKGEKYGFCNIRH